MSSIPRPTVTKCTYRSGAPYWLVCGTIPGRDRRYRKKHPTEELANHDAARIVREYCGAVDGPAHEEARLAATLVRNHPREDVRNASILDLTAWAADRYISPARLKPMADYVADLIALKKQQGRRPDTIRELEQMLGTFVRELGHVAVNDHTADDLDAWCAKQTVLQKWRSTLKHLFAYLSGEAVKSPNPAPVLARNPVRHWQKPQDDRDGTEGIVICTVGEAETLIRRAAEWNAQRMMVWMFQTGMRPIESVRFWTRPECGWNLIDLESGTIEVTKAVSKVRKWREIWIKPALRAWLELYSDHDSWLTYNWRDKYTNLRAAVLPAEKIVNDICRHTWHSFLLASGESWTDVELQAGNTKEVQMRHYARLVRNKAAVARYWDLTPDKFATFDRPEAELKQQAKANRTRAILENRKKLSVSTRGAEAA